MLLGPNLRCHPLILESMIELSLVANSHALTLAEGATETAVVGGPGLRSGEVCS